MRFNRSKCFAFLDLKWPPISARMRSSGWNSTRTQAGVGPLPDCRFRAQRSVPRPAGLRHGPEGASGNASLTQVRDGAPSYAPFLAFDRVVGEIAAGAIAAALFKRSRTGKGTSLEIPMHETMAGFVLKEHRGPRRSIRRSGPHETCRCLTHLTGADTGRLITITANSDAQAAALLRTVGRDRFLTVADRYRDASAWFGLRSALKDKPTAVNRPFNCGVRTPIGAGVLLS